MSNPLRRKSPRIFSSSSSTHQKSESKNQNAWALSLHVIDPQPLEICHPSSHHGKTSRSDRLTLSESSKKPVISKELSALGFRGFTRKSPRFSPLGLTLRSGKTIESFDQLSSVELESRKRCRSEGKDVDRVAKRLRSDSDLLLLTLRSRADSTVRSRKIEPKSISWTEARSLRSGLRGDQGGCSSGKGLRSRNVEMQVEKEKGKGKSELSDNNRRCLRSPGTNSDSRGSGSGDFRRSSRINENAGVGLKFEMLETPQRRSSVRRGSSFTDKSASSVKSDERGVRTPRTELDYDVSEEFDDEMMSQKCLRSTKVKLDGSGVRKNVVAKGNESKDKKSVQKCLRSRNVKLGGNGGKKNAGVGLKFEMLQMPQRRSSVRRSSVLTDKSTSSVKSDEKRVKTPRNKLDYDVSEEFDDEMMSQKCLRSRKVTLDGTGEKNNTVAKGNDYKDDKSVEKESKSEKSEKKKQKKVICSFVGEPIPEEEARKRWGWRYDLKANRNAQRSKVIDDEEDKIIYNVDCHYAQARVGIVPLNIGDCVYVKGEGTKKHIGKILELFRTVEGEDYFRVQWFYRAEDTVLQDAASFHDKRRLFYSTVTNDNLLDCIISKVHIVKIPAEQCLKSNLIASAAFYYDMEYCVEYTSFRTLFTETSKDGSDSVSPNSRHSGGEPVSPSSKPLALLPSIGTSNPELTLLDLYSGCGGMSTGLNLGAKLSSVHLVTKWAVDFDSSACASLKLNHPETQVRNEQAEDFLELIRRWEKLCNKYVIDLERTPNCEFVEAGDISQLDTEDSSEEYEVSHFVNICYGDPNQTGKSGLHLLVRWKGFGPEDDTWEKLDGLENCEEQIQDFVRKGFRSKILPLPGDVGVICGGPPCQGISGYNRYRNTESPLEDERNQQIMVYMDKVEFLKPKYVLMENVVDIIRFDKASLGRYALSRLVHLKYQARLGIIASGCYGVPQFRLRVFIWGAHPTEKLPQFPLPTHDVVVRYWPPLQFERNIVAYDEGQPRTLEKAIILRDSISDLPPVTNKETREEMAYEKDPETGFQTYIRMNKNELLGVSSSDDSQWRQSILYDHRPFQLSENDYLRACQIPHEKGANFCNLPGVIVGEDNVARRDPAKELLTLSTGALLVPDSILAYEQGKSKRPYARLWWDETVSTVVTFPHVRAQAILHPEQDRVLTIRECARLQGFPDFYRFCGTIKDRYRQVGNAVSVPVGRALGYALGMAYQNFIGDEQCITVPPNFSTQKPLI